MPRTIEPEKWERFYELTRQGYGRNAAASRAGISLAAVLRFEKGDPNSSGHAWLDWRRAVREGTTECPTCGRDRTA